MHWKQKVGIAMCFLFMPAMAPLWALMIDAEVEPVIRGITFLFVPGLILALSGNKMMDNIEEE
jgi:hypothetical protein